MQIFRRSNLPSLLSSNAPPQAPHDAQVREWLKRQTLPQRTMEPLARVVEKSLARKAETLNLSGFHPAAIDRLSVSLLGRLAAHTRHVVLPEGCPRDIGHRIDREFELARMTLSDLDASTAPQRGPRTYVRPSTPSPLESAGAPPAKPQAPMASDDTAYIQPIAGPRDAGDVASPYANLPSPSHTGPNGATSADYTPGWTSQASTRAVRRQRDLIEQSSVGSTTRLAETIQAGVAAMRLPAAWLRAQAAMEGDDARCAIGAADARALSAALNLPLVAALPLRERKIFTEASRVLARQVPGGTMTLSAADVKRLSRAIDELRMLGSKADLPAPALPRRPPGR